VDLSEAAVTAAWVVIGLAIWSLGAVIVWDRGRHRVGFVIVLVFVIATLTYILTRVHAQ
jgi:hypothetical protein